MSACLNCGAANEPAAVRCAYCDGALEATSSIHVAWLARTPEGVRGEGQIDLLAGGGVNAAQVRSAAESAFQAAVRGLGSQAKGADVQARMVTDLPTLLPAGAVIRELSMTAYQRDTAGSTTVVPTARPARGTIVLPMIGLLVGACAVFMGLLMVVVGESAGRRIAHIESAPVVANLAEAKGSLACLEGASVLSAADPIVVVLETGASVECLFVTSSSSGSRASVHSGSRSKSSKTGTPTFRRGVSEFSLTDGTRVKVSTSTNWNKLESLGRGTVDGKDLHLQGVRANAKVLTLVGGVQGGELTAEEISTAPSREVLIRDLSETRYVGDAMGFVCLATGAGFLLLCGVLLLRRRN